MARQRTRSTWDRLRYAVLLRARWWSAERRLLPDFLILGTPKSGTTSLYDHLCQHPHVAPALRKEISFFLGNYARGPRWYRAHFPRLADRESARAAGGALLTGEATPNYFASGKARRRIRETVPEARFILLFRNPVERAYSYHQHRSRRGVERRTFAQAIAEEEAGPGRRRRRYLYGGLYAERLRRWFAEFPREQFLLLNAESYFRDPGPTIGRARDFLGLDAWDGGPAPRLNTGRYEPMDPTLRERLAAFFAPHNAELYDMIGEDWGWQ